MASMTKVICKNCGKEFEARTADVKRGWGKFHNKSCKAKYQERNTGQYKELEKKQKEGLVEKQYNDLLGQLNRRYDPYIDIANEDHFDPDEDDDNFDSSEF